MSDLISAESWCILDYIKIKEDTYEYKIFLNGLRHKNITNGNKDNLITNPNRPKISYPEFRELMEKLFEKGFIKEVQPYDLDEIEEHLHSYYEKRDFYDITEDGEDFIDTIEDHIGDVEELEYDENVYRESELEEGEA